MKKIFTGISCLIFIILWTSCEDKTSGCLDPYAENYDVTADNACDGCCEFPTVELKLSLRFDTLAFSADSLYSVGQDTNFRFRSMKFLFSGFHFIAQDSVVQIVDSLCDESRCWRSDFTYVDIHDLDKTLGHVRYSGLIDRVTLSAGIPETLYPLLETFSAMDAELATARDSMGIEGEESLALMAFDLYRDSVFVNTYRLIDATDTLVIGGTYVNDITKGQGWKVELEFDLAGLLNGIEFSTMTEEEVEVAMLANFLKVWSLR